MINILSVLSFSPEITLFKLSCEYQLYTLSSLTAMVWEEFSKVLETQWAGCPVNMARENASFQHLADSHTGSQVNGAIF